jgi:NitT/TauT family transport system ATP-binding protein
MTDSPTAPTADANGQSPRVTIRISGVSKEFVDTTRRTQFRALSKIDLSVAEGEFVSLIGPSGCGKSTLLGLIAGFDRPSGGTIEVAGKAVSRPGPERIMVFQDYALFPWMNTIENVEFGLKVAGVARDERRRRAEQALDLVHLSSFAKRPVYRLSGGMRQRVAIARALVLRPRVLLMDEPFAALDAQQRKLMQGELMRIWSETGQTILFVTHSLEEALFLSDRVVLMSTNPGRIAQITTLDLPRPRDRTAPQFNEIVRELGSLLEREVAAAEEELERALAGT